MNCYDITCADLKPFSGRMNDVLEILNAYGFEYVEPCTPEAIPFVALNGYMPYLTVANLCKHLAPLIESGEMNYKCDNPDDNDSVITVFDHGTAHEFTSQSFVYYEGLDDPLEFAAFLPMSVMRAILAHAEEFKSAADQDNLCLALFNHEKKSAHE